MTEWKGSRAEGLHPTLGISEQAWLSFVAEQRNHICEITNQKTSCAIHHLNGVQTHPDLRWTDSNVICIATWLHVEFHFRFMGGFHVPVTRADFEAFVAYKKANDGVHQPLRGYEQPAEFLARQEHIKLYRGMTGLMALPADREMWVSNCPYQMDKPEALVNQYLDSGLVSPAQVHGVSEWADVTENNRLVHPAATFHQGEWERTILHADFNPALVILDTGMLSGERALSLTAHTMLLCPEAVLLVSVIQSSYLQDVMNRQEFIKELSKRVPDLHGWMPEGIQNFQHGRGESAIQTYAFMQKY